MTALHDPSEAAADAVAATDPTSLPTAADLVEGLAATVLNGSAVARASVGFGAELSRILLGRSEVAAARSDWRFKDPTWSQNPIYKRVGQTYLAACEAVDTVIDEMEHNGLGKRTERARFATGVVSSALAPTNTLAGQPCRPQADVRDRGHQPRRRRRTLGQ